MGLGGMSGIGRDEWDSAGLVGISGIRRDKRASAAEASLVAEATQAILPPPAATRSRRLLPCMARS